MGTLVIFFRTQVGTRTPQKRRKKHPNLLLSHKKNHNRLSTQGTNQVVTFLGTKLSISKEEVSDAEVDSYCKEKIFSAFGKTLEKLRKGDYSTSKSQMEILKKLFEKAVDFMEAGMQTIVMEIGNVIAKIVACKYPIQEQIRSFYFQSKAFL